MTPEKLFKVAESYAPTYRPDIDWNDMRLAGVHSESVAHLTIKMLNTKTNEVVLYTVKADGPLAKVTGKHVNNS